MSQSDEIKQYVKTVCEQIRWKRPAVLLQKKLKIIFATKGCLCSQGEDEKTATEKAILQMAMPFPSVWSSIKFTGQSLSGQ